MTTATPETAARNLDVDRFLAYYRTMLRIRAFERAAEAALNEGLAVGAVHLSIGQEAISTGVCGNLGTGDIIFSTHRGHGHAIAKGADPKAMMCELFGRQGGTCGGKGGSMHIADFSVGMLGANGVVAANIPIAVGAAHSLRQQRRPEVVVCLFGDGAVNRGPFLEGLNWARVFDLPIVFVCEDNQFSATTRTARLTAGNGAAARARSLDIPAEEIDGNDIVAVDAAARAAVAAARQGGGPRLLHARSYRLMGHTVSDPATYREAAEVERWRGRDPLPACAALLTAHGVAADALERLRQAAEEEIADAVAAGRAAPWPEKSAAYTDVQDIGSPEWPN